MNIASKLSGHWTDDQLIEHLYGVGPADGHLSGCPECQSRLSGMQSRKRAFAPEEVSADRLLAQRRSIYGKLTEPIKGSYRLYLRRWAAAAAAVLVFSGGLAYYQEYQQQHDRDAMLSDAQLAQDVSRMSENQEAQPVAPLQALFQK